MNEIFERTKRVMQSLAVAISLATAVHAGPPSLSTNPGNLAIFPAKGQSPEQQRAAAR
jgi:hypothetical protein